MAERTGANPGTVPRVKQTTVRFPDALWEQIEKAAGDDSAANWLREAAMFRLGWEQGVRDLEDLRARVEALERRAGGE